MNEINIGSEFTARNGFRFVLYDLFEAQKKPERKAIVKNYFYEKTITLIYGQAGHGKTWWSLYEAVCLVLGDHLLDLDIERDENGNKVPHKVLYITLEMTAKDIADRLQELTADLKPTEKKIVSDGIDIVSFEDNTNMIAGCKGFIPEALGDLCKDRFYDVIYIDSFADYVAGFDQRNEDHMRNIITQLRSFTVQHNVSFRIIHHGTKTYADGSGGSMAGIHTIRDLVDHVFSVKQTARDELRISSDQLVDPSAKARYKRSITLNVGIKTDEETYYSFYRKAENETVSNMEIMKQIYKAVEEQQGITAGELKNILGKSYTDIRDGMVGTQLRMTKERSGRGKETKHFYTSDFFENNLDETNNGETGIKRG